MKKITGWLLAAFARLKKTLGWFLIITGIPFALLRTTELSQAHNTSTAFGMLDRMVPQLLICAFLVVWGLLQVGLVKPTKR